MAGKLKKKDYEARLEALQHELNTLHAWMAATGERVLVILEGRDTAGKTGVINAITHRLNPRRTRVVALSKPSEREQGQWYFQRYVEHLPGAGELVLFDRSWYNRAGVEAVMGFCSEAEHKRFLAECPVFERLLVADGIRLFKYWLTLDQAEQERRLAERLDDPLKRWKLSPVDLAARERYADYGKARDRMLRHTDTGEAPWYMVDANDQRRMRIDLVSHLLSKLPYRPMPVEVPPFPPLSGPPGRDRPKVKVRWVPRAGD
ncbi:MAG: polyphosphate kinase 2 [Pseudoxanthomonas sp.]|nr:polyphosphate kinase 2 [Pseudoxanthomonas sp.]